MNTPINKSIFNETGCIRRDMLIGYKNQTLSPEQKHEVEEHMVDCALCNEALEGLALVSGSEVLDSLQQEVSKMVQPHATPALRPWLAAATLAGVIAISYFTWIQFKNVKEERLAEHIPAEKPEIKIDQHMMQSSPILSDTLPLEATTTNKNNVAQKSVSPNNNISATIISADEQPVVEEVMAETITGESYDAFVKDEASVKQYSSAPAAKDVITYSLPSNVIGNQNITYVDNVKVIDYTEYNQENIQQADQPRSGTAPKYENKKKSTEAELAEEKSGMLIKRKVDYIDMVADPIILFNNGRYESANSGFDELLKLNNQDQNAAFYKGLSLYNLNRYKPAIEMLEPISNDSVSPFMEEAKYYTAKSYINNGEVEKGKVMLNEIVIKNGFYSKQANEDLKNVK